MQSPGALSHFKTKTIIFSLFFLYMRITLKVEPKQKKKNKKFGKACEMTEGSYVYWTVHHLYSCVKRKNQLDATYFII